MLEMGHPSDVPDYRWLAESSTAGLDGHAPAIGHLEAQFVGIIDVSNHA